MVLQIPLIPFYLYYTRTSTLDRLYSYYNILHILMYLLVLSFSTRFRMLSGSALALNFCNYTSVIGELSSPEFRGIFSSIVLLVGRFAAVYQGTISVIFDSYKSLAVSAAILSLFFFPMTYFLIESPYFLMNEGKGERVRRSLEKLHPNASTSEIEEKLRQMKRLIESQKKAKIDASLWQIFTKKSYRKTVLRVCLINGFVQLSGAQIFTYYVTILLPSNRFVSNVSYPLIISLTTISAQLFWTAKIENFPRRILFLITCPLSSLLWISMGTIYFYDLQEQEFWKVIVYVDAIVIMAIMGALLLPLIDIISAELFPFNIKGKANACVFVSRSIFAIITLIMFDIMAQKFGNYASFYFYALTLSVLAVIVYFVLPETRGRSLIDLHFDSECENGRYLENTKLLDAEIYQNYDGTNSNGKLPTEKWKIRVPLIDSEIFEAAIKIFIWWWAQACSIMESCCEESLYWSVQAFEIFCGAILTKPKRKNTRYKPSESCYKRRF